jgi:hypothetical protein
MKTASIIVTGLVTLGVALALHTADAEAQVFQRIGIKAGLNFSSQGGDFYDFVREVGGEVNARTGISLGLFAERMVNDRLTIVPELFYAQRGVRIPGENGLRSRELDLSYAEFSAIGKITFPLETIAPFVTAGPVLGILGGATGRVDDNEQSVEDEISGADFGFAIGGGVDRGPIGIEARYVLGLKDVVTDDDEGKNRGLSVLVSYALYPR